MKSVMRTDSTGNLKVLQNAFNSINIIVTLLWLYYERFDLFLGAATIRLEMPSHMQNSLIFHYNLKFYGNDTDNYDGISLKRFVMQVKKQNNLQFRNEIDFVLESYNIMLSFIIFMNISPFSSRSSVMLSPFVSTPLAVDRYCQIFLLTLLHPKNILLESQ